MQTSERLLRKFVYSIGTQQFSALICLWWKRHESTLNTWSAAQVEFTRLTQGWQAIKSLSQQQLVNVTFTGMFFGYNSAAARGVRKEMNRHRGREPQRQRHVSVPLLLFPDSFPQYKSTKTKTNRTHFPWDKVTGREVQRSTIHLCSLLPTKGTAVGQIRTGSSNLTCLTAPSKTKHDLRHHIFLWLAFSFRQWQEPSASSTPFQFFEKGY